MPAQEKHEKNDRTTQKTPAQEKREKVTPFTQTHIKKIRLKAQYMKLNPSIIFSLRIPIQIWKLKEKTQHNQYNMAFPPICLYVNTPFSYH